MRYFIVFAIVGMLFGGLSLYSNYLANSIQQRMLQKQIDAKSSGKLSPDFEVDHDDSKDHGIEVSSSEIVQIQLLDCWFAYRIYLIPITIIGALAIARISDRSSQTQPSKVAE